MKEILTKAALILFVYLPLVQTECSAGTFVSLTSDGNNYSLNSQAVLIANIISQPSDPQMGITLQAKLNGVPMDLVPLTNNSALGETTLTTPGTSDWEVDVYLCNERLAKSLNGTIVSDEQEVGILQQELGTESDPNLQAILQQQMTKDQSEIAAARSTLNNIQSLLEVDHLSIVVLPNTATHAATPGALGGTGTIPTLLNVSLSAPSVAVGQSLTLSTHLQTNFSGESNIVGVMLDGQFVPTDIVDSDDTTTTITATGVGTHTFSVAWTIMPTATMNLLNNSLQAIYQSIAVYKNDQLTTTDSVQNSYDQYMVERLLSLTSGLQEQMYQLQTPVTSETVNFNVISSISRRAL